MSLPTTRWQYVFPKSNFCDMSPRAAWKSLIRSHLRHYLATIASPPPARYLSAVAANSATGPDNPSKMQAQQRPKSRLQAFFYARNFVQWRLCVGDLRVCRVPVSPVYQPAHSCHPIRLITNVVALTLIWEFCRCMPSIRPKSAFSFTTP